MLYYFPSIAPSSLLSLPQLHDPHGGLDLYHPALQFSQHTCSFQLPDVKTEPSARLIRERRASSMQEKEGTNGLQEVVERLKGAVLSDRLMMEV